MNDVFTQFQILPGYATGFTFTWAITQSLTDPLPWKFYIDEGPSSVGPWDTISPALTNLYSWFDGKKRVVNKDPVLYFRIRLQTPKNEYISFIKTPYADVTRREYLIVQDIMRRELLQQKDMAAVPGKLWIRATFGPKCPYCKDPVTGEVTSSNCKYCLGVGRLPPFNGPYDMWVTFSPTQRNLELKPDGTGLAQPYTWYLRIIGTVLAKDNDIVIDTRSDKRYIVDGVNNELEIRRVPVIQMAHARELPVSDPLYRLGTSAQSEEGCVLDNV